MMQAEKNKINPKYLLNPESFSKLTKLQKELESEMGWQPSLKKLVNTLITPRTCAYLKKILIGEFKDRNGEKKSLIKTDEKSAN